jgi:hypothetical protein
MGLVINMTPLENYIKLPKFFLSVLMDIEGRGLVL